MFYDDYMRRDVKKNKSAVIGWLLMASWNYYQRAGSVSPLLEDATYDGACKWLYDQWDNIDHKYKNLIDKETLKAGSMYDIGSYVYPEMITHLAENHFND